VALSCSPSLQWMYGGMAWIPFHWNWIWVEVYNGPRFVLNSETSLSKILMPRLQSFKLMITLTIPKNRFGFKNYNKRCPYMPSDFGWKHGNVCQKNSHTCSHNHIYGINMKKPIQNFLNFHYEAIVHSIEFIVTYTSNVKNFHIRKMDEMYVLN